MSPRKNSSAGNNLPASKNRIDPTVIAAIIGATALIVSAIITYIANRTQAELPIRATQTAEARLTAIPDPATMPAATSATDSTPSATPEDNKAGIAITLETASQLELLKEISIETSFGEVLFSHNGQFMAYGRWEESTRIWNADDYSFVRKLDNAGMPLLFSADDLILYTVFGRDLKAWDLSTGELKPTPFSADEIAISPDETRVALCDAKNQKLEIRSLDNSYSFITLDIKLELTGGTEKRCELTFSEDGSVLVVSDGIFFMAYDTHFWRQVERFEGVNFSNTRFSKDGKYFANGWYIFNTPDWSVRFELPTPDLVYKVSFSPDGKMVATGSQDSSVQLWNLADGSLVKMIKGLNTYPPMAGLSFSPSGDALVVVTDKIQFYGIKK